MAEWRLFDQGTIPHVSTADFHADRERAQHLEQPAHRPRLLRAAQFVFDAASLLVPGLNPWHDWGVVYPVTVSDLGCGDGGLLSLIQGKVSAAWGYDFAPANAAGWAERGISAESLDVFGVDRDRVKFGDITVATEVLEHIADPHGVVRWIADNTRYLVASSPRDETLDSHDECHAWAWDMDGYRALIEQAGFKVLRHETVGRFQIVLAVAP